MLERITIRCVKMWASVFAVSSFLPRTRKRSTIGQHHDEDGYTSPHAGQDPLVQTRRLQRVLPLPPMFLASAGLAVALPGGMIVARHHERRPPSSTSG